MAVHQPPRSEDGHDDLLPVHRRQVEAHDRRLWTVAVVVVVDCQAVEPSPPHCRREASRTRAKLEHEPSRQRQSSQL